MSEGKFHYAKAWLGCALHTPDEDVRPEVVYFTTVPIVAVTAAEAKRVIFAAAIRANESLPAGEVEAFVVPFSPCVD